MAAAQDADDDGHEEKDYRSATEEYDGVGHVLASLVSAVLDLELLEHLGLELVVHGAPLGCYIIPIGTRRENFRTTS